MSKWRICLQSQVGRSWRRIATHSVYRKSMDRERSFTVHGMGHGWLMLALLINRQPLTAASTSCSLAGFCWDNQAVLALRPAFSFFETGSHRNGVGRWLWLPGFQAQAQCFGPTGCTPWRVFRIRIKRSGVWALPQAAGKPPRLVHTAFWPRLGLVWSRPCLGIKTIFSIPEIEVRKFYIVSGEGAEFTFTVGTGERAPEVYLRKLKGLHILQVFCLLTQSCGSWTKF